MPDPTPARPRRWRPMAALRNSFLAGIVVIAPIGLTAWLFWAIMGWVDGVVMPLVPWRYRPENTIGVNVRGLGVVVFLVFTILVGWIAKGVIGRSLLAQGERVVDRTPVVRSVYGGLKQIAETIFSPSGSSFKTVCLVEYPRREMWAIGFVSTEARGEVPRRLDAQDDLITVFVPRTPNPTTGLVVYVPRSAIIELEMSVEEAAKLVISAGLVQPPDRLPARPSPALEPAD